MKSQLLGKSRLRLLALGAGVALFASAAACASNVEQKAPEQQEEAAAKELKRDGHHRWRGPVDVVIDAARSEGHLSAEQEATLSTIADELKVNRQDRRQMREKMRTSAVNVVRSGTADSKEFEQSVTEVVQTFEKRMDQNADALVEIHTILKPEQRASVATALRAHLAEKFGPREHRGYREGDGFKRFATHLMLSTFQVEQLKTMAKELMGDKERLRPSRDELEELVTAFEGDSFSSTLDEFQTRKKKILREHVAQAGARTDSALAVFTPEQRELLADMIQEGPRKVLLGQDAARDEANTEPSR